MAEAQISDAQHTHPNDLQYIGIAAILAVLTAIEVGLYYLKHDTATTVALLVLMTLKFAMVVAYFMHLRMDKALLRALFVGGLILATTVYIVMEFMFGAFHV